MPPPSANQPKDTKSQRLGAVLRKLREEQGVSAAGLAKQTGLSRSYVTYLESGKFAEVGLDKFSRIVRALGLSADRVLRDAGYLPATTEGLPDPTSYLKATFGLSPPGVDQALAFLQFLAARDRASTKERRPRRTAAKGKKR